MPQNDYLLSGSVAYDTILIHKGEFHERIMPESLKRINVSFGIDSHKTEYGGTGGNIAYNAALLKQNPMLVSSVGNDAGDYIEHLKDKGIDTNYLTIINHEPTAHVWIPTDAGNSQFAFFAAGAMKYKPALPAITPDLWHLSPESQVTTAALAKEAIAQGKQYFFDPGQALPGFLEGIAESVMPLKDMILQAKGLFVNEYEAELLCLKTGVSLENLVKDSNRFVVKTKGGDGVELITAQGVVSLPVARANAITDPTGCGDAFRAGFLSSYTQGKSLVESVELGAVMGSFAVETSGGQNHHPTLEEINRRLIESYPKTGRKIKP